MWYEFTYQNLKELDHAVDRMIELAELTQLKGNQCYSKNAALERFTGHRENLRAYLFDDDANRLGIIMKFREGKWRIQHIRAIGDHSKLKCVFLDKIEKVRQELGSEIVFDLRDDSDHDRSFEMELLK